MSPWNWVGLGFVTGLALAVVVVLIGSAAATVRSRWREAGRMTNPEHQTEFDGPADLRTLLQPPPPRSEPGERTVYRSGGGEP